MTGVLPGRRRVRFAGTITGVGSAGGVRVVVGHWRHSPLGSFGDAMVALPGGRRLLVAPSDDVARFVAATYAFDEIRVEPVAVVETATALSFRSSSLRLDLTVGRRTALGVLLRLVPDAVARSPWWCRLIDPAARRLQRGVRTYGVTAGGTRREWYGAGDHRAVTGLAGTWEGADLGSLQPVDPPPRFGFSSTPRRPSRTRVTTTIELDSDVVLVSRAPQP